MTQIKGSALKPGMVVRCLHRDDIKMTIIKQDGEIFGKVEGQDEPYGIDPDDEFDLVALEAIEEKLRQLEAEIGIHQERIRLLLDSISRQALKIKKDMEGKKLWCIRSMDLAVLDNAISEVRTEQSETFAAASQIKVINDMCKIFGE